MSARDRDWFVARMGQSTEQDGFPKIAGQLFGLLLWSEEPCSIQEMTDILGVSKASVSTDARRLLEHGVFERVPRDGDRRDYYQIAPDFFRKLLQHRLERWENAHDSVIEAREKLKPSAKVAKRLEYMHAVNEFVLERLRKNLADWDSQSAPVE